MNPDDPSSACPALGLLGSPSGDEAEADDTAVRSVSPSAALLCDFADEVARGTDAVRALIARHAGRLVPLPWPEGAGVLVDPSVAGWEVRPGVRNRLLQHCCCDVLVYVVGRGAGLPAGFELDVLMDVFGRYYAYRGGADDALYLLSTSAEDFAAVGYRFLYPLHCRAGLGEVGIVLGRLWLLVRQGADADAVARFVVRGHGESVGVARRLPGVREVLRLCSLGCLRWSARRDAHARGGGGLLRAPVPDGDDAVVPLGRVRRGCWPAFGTPVFVGVPTGRVFAGDVCDGSYVLVADSLPGFSGIGVSRFFENRRFARRDLGAPPEDEEERRRSGRERRPPCLADLFC
ncbi:pR24 [rat cytomegalovirus strain Maastricht]|uniref:PR24 n=1 Tax=Rat cytomegalovirus (strain Maastricht) TaxID=79700 RepID=Q9DWG8_RCMVM|nr:pR24 [rat cytomegalovirus strain Maastricht]AAF99121.1 pR24 [rat cytomegalovirus strain Maastricht]WEG71947.1 tegument protein UL24 [Murid betaherpesvirus 2]